MESLILRQDINSRKPRTVSNNIERLSITLRFLAIDESQESLSFSYGMGKSTVSNVISAKCDAIYNVIWKIYLQPPSSSDEWLAIAKDFEEGWNLPYVVGAFDWIHIRILCPPDTGTLFHNC